MNTSLRSRAKYATLFCLVFLTFGFAGKTSAGEKDWSAEGKDHEVVIKKDGERVTSIKTTCRKVVDSRFLKWEGIECVAVKSKNDTGPAALELFNRHNGVLLDKIMDDTTPIGAPAWALPWLKK